MAEARDDRDLEARVIDRHVAGDHTIFVAAPVGVRVGDNDRPLTSLDLDYVYLGGKKCGCARSPGWDRLRDGAGWRSLHFDVGKIV